MSSYFKKINKLKGVLVSGVVQEAVMDFENQAK